jgi:hypothetical protein
MNLISYEELAQLRLADFLGRDVELSTEESGMRVVVGLGGYEEYGETFFGWRQGEPYQTAEVTLDLGPESILPSDAADRIIERLGLPICKGMAASELIRVLGSPSSDKAGSPGTRLLRFICGQKDVYLVGCQVHEQHGLIHLFMARKDYCDEDEAL